eukprot:CAMPEP_0171311910 /NCGR_PEP_ID=MMETSP0816-20121228/22207_1 /TAXON_ID=420281 /ORGANISM="Proboscia inermis, Strain CCAP1064/1" /LENGTH=177 /DNA_ID=CAMNT_0011796999 /DNA_START=632 /DNA_END=1165 /DNA_ORIENTATION=+
MNALIEKALYRNPEKSMNFEEEENEKTTNINNDNNSRDELTPSPRHTAHYNTFNYRNSTMKGHRRVSSATRARLNSWNEEVDVRSLYGANPPADYLPDKNGSVEDDGEQFQQSGPFDFPWSSMQIGQNSGAKEDNLSENGEKEEDDKSIDSLTQERIDSMTREPLMTLRSWDEDEIL